MWLELGGWIFWWAFRTPLPLPAAVPLIICSTSWYHFANPNNCTLRDEVFLKLLWYVHPHTFEVWLYTKFDFEYNCGAAVEHGRSIGAACKSPAPACDLAGLVSHSTTYYPSMSSGISHCWQPASPVPQVTMLSSPTAERGYSKSSWVLSRIFCAPKQEGRIQPP